MAAPSPAAEIASPAKTALEPGAFDPGAFDPGAFDLGALGSEALESDTTAGETASADQSNLAKIETVSQPPVSAPAATADAAVAEFCIPLSEDDPCGPDLDLAGDADYLNFFAQAEGMLPSSFFSSDDGKPFDRASIDLRSQVDAITPLWDRSRDLRLLVMRARLLILDRDLGGFATAIAAIAQWLERFRDDVHPRANDGDFGARVAALGALDLPTVVFPLQYAPLCEGRRIGTVTYRAWMIAAGEVKPRPGEQKHPSAALTEAIADAAPEALAATRRHVATIKTSLGRIREIFMLQGSSLGLENLPALVDKMQGLVDPRAVLDEAAAAQFVESHDGPAPAKERSTGVAAGEPPASLAEAQQALAAIAAYYSRSEPSSPTLPLVRQAHQLIGKSFFEVMSILVPTQMDKAAFQIAPTSSSNCRSASSRSCPMGRRRPTVRRCHPTVAPSVQYRVESRAQAIALLEQVSVSSATPSPPVRCRCCATAPVLSPSGISWVC